MSAPHPRPTAPARRRAPPIRRRLDRRADRAAREQVSRLVRDEVRLAQAEVTQKAKRLGIGAGFSAAPVWSLLARRLVTAAILGLANVLPGWLAAVLVAVVLFAVAGCWR